MKQKYKATLVIIFETDQDVPDAHVQGTDLASFEDSMDKLFDALPAPHDIDFNSSQIEASFTMHKVP